MWPFQVAKPRGNLFVRSAVVIDGTLQEQLGLRLRRRAVQRLDFVL